MKAKYDQGESDTILLTNKASFIKKGLLKSYKVTARETTEECEEAVTFLLNVEDIETKRNRDVFGVIPKKEVTQDMLALLSLQCNKLLMDKYVFEYCTNGNIRITGVGGKPVYVEIPSKRSFIL